MVAAVAGGLAMGSARLAVDLSRAPRRTGAIEALARAAAEAAGGRCAVDLVVPAVTVAWVERLGLPARVVAGAGP